MVLLQLELHGDNVLQDLKLPHQDAECDMPFHLHRLLGPSPHNLRRLRTQKFRCIARHTQRNQMSSASLCCTVLLHWVRHVDNEWQHPMPQPQGAERGMPYHWHRSWPPSLHNSGRPRTQKWHCIAKHMQRNQMSSAPPCCMELLHWVQHADNEC
jgi:hypothetical protein